MIEETYEDIMKDFAQSADMQGLDYAISQGYIDKTRLYGINDDLAFKIADVRIMLNEIEYALGPYMP